MTAIVLPQSLRSVDPEERVPPASLDAERACIGAVLLREEILPDLEELVLDDFYLPAHRAIWQAIQGMVAARRKVDIIGLSDELRVRGDLLRLEGGTGYLAICAEAIPHLEGAGRYALMVRQKARLRGAIQLSAELQSRAYGEHGDIDAFFGEARDRFAQLENAGSGQGPVRIGTEMANALETIESRALHPEKHAVMTGVGRFDRKIGGLRPERLICVAAPPGIGKSAWAGTVAVNAAIAGVPALLISLEMSRQELIERFLSGESKVSVKDLGTGDIARPENGILFSTVHEAARRLSEIPLFVDDRDRLTGPQVVGTIRRWYAEHLGAVPSKETQEPPKPAFVAVDYVQLVDDDQDGDNRNLAIGRFTRSLKQLSKALRIPVVILSQLNRTHAKRGGKPVLSDLRDSGSIEQDSDQVIFLWRDAEQDAEGRERRGGSGPAEWLVAKNRGGPMGSVKVWWAAEQTRFYDLDTTAREED